VREGDIIVALAGEPTPRIETLHRLLSADRIDRATEIQVLRGVELLTSSITPTEK
jgi:S1-C subfamily serine protease